MAKNTSGIDLAQLFGAVATNLLSEKDNLNKADAYNNDHGDNMVQTFETIAKAVQKKQTGSPAEQLAYAGKSLRSSKSGSAQVYADGLMQASEQLHGQDIISTENANLMLQSLLGGGSAPTSNATAGGDLLGSLLGGLTGGDNPQNDDAGLDMGDLLNAGLAFMNAKQSGSSNMEAAINALISASPLGESAHRSQSSAVVANTIMQVIGGAISGK